MKMRALTPLCGALLLAGCLAEPTVGPAPAPTQPGPTPPTTTPPVDITAGQGTVVDLQPEPEAPEVPVRQRRRMDLDQLDASIRRVTGGIGWTEIRSGREVNLFDELAQTLGKPDYLQITDEDLEPSAMFQKFLDDAARTVCRDLMQQEDVRASNERVFFVHATPDTSLAETPQDALANLQYLLLRFHGRHLAADSAEMEPWRWLMQSAEHVTNDQAVVWQTLCVGLMTHPDFYTY